MLVSEHLTVVSTVNSNFNRTHNNNQKLEGSIFIEYHRPFQNGRQIRYNSTHIIVDYDSTIEVETVLLEP